MSLPPVKPYNCSVEFNQDRGHASAAERQGAGPKDIERAKQHVRSTTTHAASSSNTLVYSPPFLTDDLSRKALCHQVNVVAARETVLLLGRVQSGPRHASAAERRGSCPYRSGAL